MFVDGWTDRPSTDEHTRPIWNSYAEFVWWGQETPDAVARWIEFRHWREDSAGRAVLFGVFLELLRQRIEMRNEKPSPAGQETTSD